LGGWSWLLKSQRVKHDTRPLKERGPDASIPTPENVRDPRYPRAGYTSNAGQFAPTPHRASLGPWRHSGTGSNGSGCLPGYRSCRSASASPSGERFYVSTMDQHAHCTWSQS
jgi:hypothetical protein